MGGTVSVDDSELKAYIKKLEGMRGTEVQAIMNGALNQVGNRFIRKVKQKTPVKSGTLRRNWSMKTAAWKHTGNVYELRITNPTEYGEYVENGHRKGNSWVSGQFFTKTSETEMQRIMGGVCQRYIEKKLKEFLNA